jgi:hypothetical protein
MAFKPAQKKKSKLKLAIQGPSGSGKTYSALAIACGLGKRVAVIDSEGTSAQLYSDNFQFDCDTLEKFSPLDYIAKIKEAEDSGYDVIVIDSLSHEWFGVDGALDLVSKESIRNKGGNSYFAWRNVTPLHNQLINTIIQSKTHIIATMRTKESYVVDDQSGKKVPKKIGLEAIQRDGIAFEFTIVCDIDMEHNLIVTKTRMSELDGAIVNRPGKAFADTLLRWLDSGVDVVPEPVVVATPTPKPKPAPKPKVVEPVVEAETEPTLDGLSTLEPFGTSEVDTPIAATKEIDVAVQQHLEKFYGYVRTSAIEDPEEAILGAKLMIQTKFGSDPDYFSQDELDTALPYFRGELLESLRREGFIR